MNKKNVSIMVAEEDNEIRESLVSYINSQSDMEVVFCTDNGESALNFILNEKPQIAIINLFLPLYDGIAILDDLKEKNFTDTSVITLSFMRGDTVVKKILSLGGKYCIIKPFKNEVVVKQLRNVLTDFDNLSKYDYLDDAESEDFEELINEEVINEEINLSEEVNVIEEEINVTKEDINHNSSNSEISNLFSMGNKPLSIDLIVSNLLNRLNISPSLRGYMFLRSSIKVVYNKPDSITALTKNLYPDVAREYYSTSSKVERAMRHAIDTCWKKGYGEVYCEIMNFNCSEKPTNGQFIATIAEYIRVNYSIDAS